MEKGTLAAKGTGIGWLMSEKTFKDFELAMDYRLALAPNANSGVYLRAWPDGRLDGSQFLEIQLGDDVPGDAKQKTGAVAGLLAPEQPAKAPPGEWHKLRITFQGRKLRVAINERTLIDTYFFEPRVNSPRFLALNKDSGSIGLRHFGSKIEFRDIRIKELKTDEEAVPILP